MSITLSAYRSSLRWIPRHASGCCFKHAFRLAHTSGGALVVEPLTAAIVEPAAHTMAESLSSRNALALALGASSNNLLPWAQAAMRRSADNGLSFVLTDRTRKSKISALSGNINPVVSVYAAHFAPKELASISDFEASVAAMTPSAAAYPRFVREIAYVAYDHIHVAAPVVFGRGAGFRVVYSGPGATATAYMGRQVFRPLCDRHFGAVAALDRKENLAMWFFTADPAPLALMRRLEAATSVGGGGAALRAGLDQVGEGALPLAHQGCARWLHNELNKCEAAAAASRDSGIIARQPAGTPIDEALGRPLDGWLLGRSSASSCDGGVVAYAVKRIALSFGSFGYVHPGLAAAGHVAAPAELTVALLFHMPQPDAS